MTAPLGVRICGELGCSRRTHVTETGIHYSRCLAHTLMLLSGVFAAPGRASETVSPVSGSDVLPVAAIGNRPAA